MNDRLQNLVMSLRSACKILLTEKRTIENKLLPLENGTIFISSLSFLPLLLFIFFSFFFCTVFLTALFISLFSHVSLSLYTCAGLNAMFIKYDDDDSGYLDLDEIAQLLSDTAPTTTVSENDEDHANDAIEILRSLGG